MKKMVLFFPAGLLLAAAAALAQNAPAPPAQADTTPVTSATAPSISPAPVAPSPSVVPPTTATTATPAPAHEHKPKAAIRKAIIKKRLPLDPPATAQVKSNAVNVRTQPGFNGEVLGHLKKGETVVVQAEVFLGHVPKGEPSEWSEISLPADVPVWVDGHFIDYDSHTVKANRINLRGGPGERFTILGHLDKGAAITEIRKEKDWIAIQAPSNAYAYVAAGFLEIQAPSAPEAPPPAVSAPAVPVPVVTANAPAPVTPAPAANETATAAPPPIVAPPPKPAPAPAPTPSSPEEVDKELAALRHAEATEIPPDAPPRIVTREGYVHRLTSVQAPAEYELHDIRSDTLIEFLRPAPSSDFQLRTFLGTRVSVMGPEFVDHRWPRVPILQVQTITLIP